MGAKAPLLPRSVSSQEGMSPPPGATLPTPRFPHQRKSDVGLPANPLIPPGTSPSTSTSPGSSGPHSPGGSGVALTLQGRPSSLHGLKHKIASTFIKAPRRKPAQTMPLSPLARTENLPAPGGAQPSGATSPTRSPSPLAGGVVTGPSPGKLGAVKKTITKPRKSDPGGSELLRQALSPPPGGEMEGV